MQIQADAEREFSESDYLEQETCTTCKESYDRDSPGCEEHTEWRIESVGTLIPSSCEIHNPILPKH